MIRGMATTGKCEHRLTEMTDDTNDASIQDRPPRTLLPLRRSPTNNRWTVEVAPGRWIGAAYPVIAVERIGVWVVMTYASEELVKGHPSTAIYSSLARLAVPDEQRGVWDNWSCFTARPIPIHVDDDARGFVTASGEHVDRGIKIKNICEFQLGYAVVQDNQEALAAGVRQLFAIDHDGHVLWEMGQSAGFCQGIYPWDEGNLILYSSGVVLEAASGKILDMIKGIPEFFKS